MMKTLPAAEALERYFLEARAKLLDIAAILDRIDRGGKRPNDPRLEKIRQALVVLGEDAGSRAERIQQIFSLAYDTDWPRPTPRAGK